MHDSFAALPPPPYYALISSSLRTGADEAGYQAAVERAYGNSRPR